MKGNVLTYRNRFRKTLNVLVSRVSGFICFSSLAFGIALSGNVMSVSAQQILPSLGGDRAGLSGFQFTKINVDPRSAAMGASNMADAVGASSLYWNPAMAAQTERSEVMAAHTSYFADIPMHYLAGVYRWRNVALGASLHYLTSGEMDVTTEFDPQGTGQTFATQHYSIGLTASHKITESFSYGITLRYLNESFFEIEYPTFGIDFGFFYAVSGTNLRFGVGISNFGLDATGRGSLTRPVIDTDGSEKTEDEFENLLLPTRFSIAAAYDVIQNETHGLLLTAQITNPSDNAEQFGLGAEYSFLGQFFLRSGYQFGVDESSWPSVGAGIKMPITGRKLMIDYAFSGYERLGDVHRLSMRISL